MTILSHLNHTVSVVHITKESGTRKITSTDTGVAACVRVAKTIVQDQYGDHLAVATIVYLKPSQTVGDEDELIVDSVQRPISRIVPARSSRSNEIKFKKVILK
jgi:hypothetical protein